MKQQNCSVKGCFEDKANGDFLFCEHCRKKWIEMLNERKLAYPEWYVGYRAKMFERTFIMPLLKKFKDESIYNRGQGCV